MDYSFLENKYLFAALVAVVGVVTALLTAVLLGGGPTELGYVLAGGIATAVIVVGTYFLGRRYGHPHSHAVAEAAVAFGVMYLIAVTYRLLTEFGQRSQAEVLGGLAVAIVGSALFVAATVALGRFGPSPN